MKRPDLQKFATGFMESVDGAHLKGNISPMNNVKVMSITLLSIACLLVLGFSYRGYEDKQKASEESTLKGCVFRTVMGEESSENFGKYKTPEHIQLSLNRGLSWISGAQNPNGGWGAGTHSRQDVRDPHAVHADPATTAMVCMALLRTGNTLRYGEQSAALAKGLQYLLATVETSSPNNPSITSEQGTQIQIKLGQNIDAILTAQFLSNVLQHAGHDATLYARIKSALSLCVKKIARNQEADGSMAGAGWAGVLQSAFATSALESAEASGIQVDSAVLARSRDYQRGNYDAKTGEAKTDMGAGIVLYSVTGSARATAKEARKIKEDIEEAKKSGRIRQSAPVSAQTLSEIGYTPAEAAKGFTTYEVYETAKVKAQQDDVMSGFGNNGGEEFLSYLQTGEGLVINKDQTWQKWYEDISGRILKIQNNDGSWNGHHCITSPVFCTATCLLILSISNDIEKLTDVGKR